MWRLNSGSRCTAGRDGGEAGPPPGSDLCPKQQWKKARLWSLENMKWQRVPFVWELTWCKADTVHPLGVDLQSGSNARTRSVGRDGERTLTWVGGEVGRWGLLNISKNWGSSLGVFSRSTSTVHIYWFPRWQFSKTSSGQKMREITCGSKKNVFTASCKICNRGQWQDSLHLLWLCNKDKLHLGFISRKCWH